MKRVTRRCPQLKDIRYKGNLGMRAKKREILSGKSIFLSNEILRTLSHLVSQIIKVRHIPSGPLAKLWRFQMLRFEFSSTPCPVNRQGRTLKYKLHPWMGFPNKFLGVSLSNMNEQPVITRQLRKDFNVKNRTQN